MLQVCQCGTAPGYPHSAYCPYPLYRGSERQEARWWSIHNNHVALRDLYRGELPPGKPRKTRLVIRADKYGRVTLTVPGDPRPESFPYILHCFTIPARLAKPSLIRLIYAYAITHTRGI